MALPVWQGTIVRNNGDVVPNCEFEVVLESTGSDATIYSDRAGATPISAPYFADADGKVRFYAAMGDYRIIATDSGTGFTDTFRYEPIFSPDSDFTTDAGTDMLIEQFNLRANVSIESDAQYKGSTTIDVSGSSNITLTESQERARTLIFTGTTTGDINVSTSSDDAQTWLVINNDTGGNTITFKTSTGTGVAFSQEGDEREVRSDGTNMVNVCRHALGEAVAVPNGGIIPPTENYVILSDTSDDTASYNSGKVDNEQTTSSGATVAITFDIDDTDSPYDNETWECWNSSGRNPSAGTSPGTLSNDEGQQLTGELAMGGNVGVGLAAGPNLLGVFSLGDQDFANVVDSAAASGYVVDFDSAGSTDSRQDSDRFHYKREQVTYYRRFK